MFWRVPLCSATLRHAHGRTGATTGEAGSGGVSCIEMHASALCGPGAGGGTSTLDAINDALYGLSRGSVCRSAPSQARPHWARPWTKDQAALPYTMPSLASERAWRPHTSGSVAAPRPMIMPFTGSHPVQCAAPGPAGRVCGQHQLAASTRERTF